MFHKVVMYRLAERPKPLRKSIDFYDVYETLIFDNMLKPQ